MTTLPHLLRAAAFATLAIATTADAAPPRRIAPLSLEWVVTKGERPPEVQRIYVSRQKVRAEVVQGDGASEGFFLVDLASGDTKIVMPSRKAYLDWPRDTEEPTFAEQLGDPCERVKRNAEELACGKTGTSTVEGRRTEVWKITSKQDPSLVAEEIHFDPELGIPLKQIEMSPDGDGPRETSVARNLKIGDPPASMFAIPAGYRKMSDDEFAAEAVKQAEKDMAKQKKGKR